MSDPVPTVIFFDLGDTLIDSQGKRYSDALDTLQILRERGYRLGLLSNQVIGTSVGQVSATLTTLALNTYIEDSLITISTEITGNVGKPNKPIFDLALQKAQHPAASAQSIFVTETASHIQAARGYGWRAIQKRNTGTCQPGDGECVTSLNDLLNLLPELANITGTNFNLAPPAKLVDGLWTVPADIQHISAILTFDASTSSGMGDATLEFKMGRYTGHPIFDLRQTITASWVDGVSLPITKLAHHSFGGGANAELRIVELPLAAGSAHTLRVTYQVGIPHASMAGSYLPAMQWSAGPRLALSFGFTDLGPGRYLEAWVPANLIFDQFELDLELRIVNTTVAHTVVTNGTVTSLGVNHWRVNWPSRSTTFSPLLELRAQDTLETATDTVTLPVSGQTVSIEAWKLPNDPLSPSVGANLPLEINHIKTYLTNNENSTGPYAHGNRFISFLHRGGMEYDGGTTTAIGSLQHETFHSWWARGLKPASQSDAWFDEAWTVYNDEGALGSQPFNSTDPAVTLCPRNPWSRVTAPGAYNDGIRFWKGVAALIGVNTLNTLMSDLYKQRLHELVTTTDIEEFLICRTGNSQLVDAFHRFVYGFVNPASTPDLWLRDDPGHTGADAWLGSFWDSPDLWVRNSDDGGVTHQPPEYGQSNWFYARVGNRGTTTVRHFVVTFNVKQYAGTEFGYPNDFLPCVAAASGFDLAPGASVILKARWPRSLVPPPSAHACLLATVLTKGDQPIAGRHVWEQNNLAQKNLSIVDLKPNTWFVLPFVVSNQHSFVSRSFHLELIRPKDHLKFEASLMHSSQEVFKRVPNLELTRFEVRPSTMDHDTTEVLDCGGHVLSQLDREVGVTRILTSDEPELLARQFTQGVEASFAGGANARVLILVRPQEQLTFGLRLRLPVDACTGDVLHLDVIQRDVRSGRALGGIAVQINVA
jgi:FMN phosphatase YigB (HAD superfamily)